ncbi:PaeR7I family type II restriction endonuclease [Shewanella xiamenensis]|uniref:PaeR7I family type II restriction endonuclease n=1 Tax=Shewanella TaxID=22 RepID=UPI0021D847B2|nr:PaeR7I family type II restriction endonuclease [Shewanella sp. SM55]MCU8063405.1 PaeR7I family type II restriction endonuclease [Shewanella sp. SM55]
MNDKIREAVKSFWSVRSGGAGVLGGKTLDGFINIIEDTIKSSGLEDVEIHTGKNSSQLPGFFRPHKSWDVVAISKGNLVAAIELKSQVGSIGNNFNNRTEEVLGSGIDLHTAIEESAFGDNAEIFTGYLILVEDSNNTRRSATINMNFFPVMPGFLADEGLRKTTYKPSALGKYPSVEGISYLERYDLLCKRLVLKNMYTATALIVADEEHASTGDYRDFSPQTSLSKFLMKLDNHCRILARYGG